MSSDHLHNMFNLWAYILICGLTTFFGFDAHK